MKSSHCVPWHHQVPGLFVFDYDQQLNAGARGSSPAGRSLQLTGVMRSSVILRAGLKLASAPAGATVTLASIDSRVARFEPVDTLEVA